MCFYCASSQHQFDSFFFRGWKGSVGKNQGHRQSIESLDWKIRRWHENHRPEQTEQQAVIARSGESLQGSQEDCSDWGCAAHHSDDRCLALYHNPIQVILLSGIQALGDLIILRLCFTLEGGGVYRFQGQVRWSFGTPTWTDRLQGWKTARTITKIIESAQQHSIPSLYISGECIPGVGNSCCYFHHHNASCLRRYGHPKGYEQQKQEPTSSSGKSGDNFRFQQRFEWLNWLRC